MHPPLLWLYTLPYPFFNRALLRHLIALLKLLHVPHHQSIKDPFATESSVSCAHYHVWDTSFITLTDQHAKGFTSWKDRDDAHTPSRYSALLCQFQRLPHHCSNVPKLDAFQKTQGKLQLCLLYGNSANPRNLHTETYQQHHFKDAPHILQERLGMCTNGAGARHGCLENESSSLELLCEQGNISMAVDLLFRFNAAASTKTYFCLLQACNKNKKDLSYANQIYAHMVHHKASKTTFLGDYLAMTLANCGALEDACREAYNLPRRSVFTWTSIISAYAECGRPEDAIRLHRRMLEDGVEPNSYTYVSLFKACGKVLDLDSGKKLHAEARTRGLAAHVFVGSTLVSMYGKCGALVEAEHVFVSLPCRDPVTWSAMVTAYIEQKRGDLALRLFRQMREEAVTINHSTLILALQALANMEDILIVSDCSSMGLLKRVGQSLHAETRRKGLVSDIMVGSALLSMYGKYGTTRDADNVFIPLLHRDAVLWNAMISAYVELGDEEKSLHFYKQMQEDGLSPDETTFMMVFRACGNIAEKDTHLVTGQSNKVTMYKLGQALHGDARRLGFASDTQVANTLVCMYGRCGAIIEAEEVFNGLTCRGVVSWTVLLSAYAEHGHAEKALEFYKEMESQHVTKDDIALVSSLQACGVPGVVDICRQLHFEIVAAGFDKDFAIVTTLVITYRSCAFMSEARACFDEQSQPTAVLWNACMAGYAGEGSHIACLAMFENMSAVDTKLNELTFISALSACRHSGLVGASLEYFESISRDYGINPNTKHYGVVLDLLGRVGDFKRVQNMLERMPLQADAAVWFSLLGACGTHGDIELAKWAFKNAVELKPEHTGAYVLLLKVCRDPGLEGFAAKVEYCLQVQGAMGIWSEWGLCQKEKLAPML